MQAIAVNNPNEIHFLSFQNAGAEDVRMFVFKIKTTLLFMLLVKALHAYSVQTLSQQAYLLPALSVGTPSRAAAR
jgi:hypothetical protein